MRFGSWLVGLGIVVLGSMLGMVWAQTAGGGGASGATGGGGGLGLPWDGALGGGGVGLAGLIFYFYRQDRKSAEDSMIKMGSEFRAIVEANTRAITTLTTVIERSDDEGHGA